MHVSRYFTGPREIILRIYIREMAKASGVRSVFHSFSIKVESFLNIAPWIEVKLTNPESTWKSPLAPLSLFGPFHVTHLPPKEAKK